jgi:hypothetical protein
MGRLGNILDFNASKQARFSVSFPADNLSAPNNIVPSSTISFWHDSCAHAVFFACHIEKHTL